MVKKKKITKRDNLCAGCEREDCSYLRDLELQGKGTIIDEENLVTDPDEVSALKVFYEINCLENYPCENNWVFIEEGSVYGWAGAVYGRGLEVKGRHLVSLSAGGTTILGVGALGIRDLGALAGLPHLTSLVLCDSEVHDLRPLANLTCLRELNLAHNEIKDLTGLEQLENLNDLCLRGNSIIDLSPLTPLGKLEKLDLSFTTLVDLDPIANLKSLRELILEHTSISVLGRPITDLRPLASLTNLITLDLHGHQATDFSPLTKLKHMKVLCLDGTYVNEIDTSPLEHLTNLEHLSLPIHYCPVKD